MDETKFLWGASSAAYQVEGGITNNWSKWEEEVAEKQSQKSGGKYPPENFICGKSVDHYNRFKEDIDLLVSLGMNSYRFSIEWARIEPTCGNWNNQEIYHYRTVIDYLVEKKIKPVICLLHFTLPIWFEELGGWTKKENIVYFFKFASKMINTYSDVKMWLTMNEPVVYSIVSYFLGEWPPCKKNPIGFKRVIKNLAKAHKKIYKNEKCPELSIGFAKNMMNFRKIGYMLGFTQYTWNEMWFEYVDNNFDFVGINYYMSIDVSWSMVRKATTNMFEDRDKADDNISDMGWEIYPEGIYQMIKSVSKYNKPIYITENGIADEGDTKRGRFIDEHIDQVLRAKNEGIDVRGYFYWALTDNFEWNHGKWPRFGLIEVNYDTLERKVRNSAKIYSNKIKQNSF